MNGPPGRQGFLPHDLLWTDGPGALKAPGPLPDWACAGWLAQAPVVLRREQMADARWLPVGLRGRQRSQRFAAYLRRDAVHRRLRPEELAGMPLPPGAPAALQDLRRVAPALDALGLPWGPTGGAGFQLASGLPVLHDGSDLDLLLRAPRPLDAGQLRALRAAIGLARGRVDLQVDTGRGGFLFSEWAGGAARVLLRTADGPVLLRDPWRPAAVHASCRFARCADASAAKRSVDGVLPVPGVA